MESHLSVEGSSFRDLNVARLLYRLCVLIGLEIRTRGSERVHALGERGLVEGEATGNVCVMAGALAFQGGAPVVVVEEDEGILYRPGFIISMGKKAE